MTKVPLIVAMHSSTASLQRLCIHPIWMWDAVNGLHTYYSIMMHPYAHPEHLKVLNTLYISNMDVGCSQWGFAASTMTPKHDTGSATPHSLKNSPPPAHVLQHEDAPICPSTPSQGVKHFVYIQYGCGKQSMGVCSLNHDTATSYRLSKNTPFSLKFTHTCTRITAMGIPICPSKASQGAKTLCIHPICVWDAFNGGLQPQP